MATQPMPTQAAIEPSTAPVLPQRDRASSARLWGGFFGRAWLWFAVGCLVVTFVPMLFGWRPYVVESGSMQPRIKVGDVILASPEHNAAKLLGRVTVFDDPDLSRAGTVKSHRVIKINDDGTLVTKGDANPTADPTPVPMSDVKGIGRLLVRWVGLPLVWVQNGAWLKLALLVLTFWFAAVLVVRDRDDEVEDDDVEDDDDDPDTDTDARDHVTGPRVNLRQPQRWRPLRRSRHRRSLSAPEIAKMVVARTTVMSLTASALLVPTARAAFSATTADTASTWSAAASFGPSYTSDTQALNPYLYWKLDDTGVTDVATDYSGNNRNGKYSPAPSGGSWTMQQVGGLTGQAPNLAVTATGGRAANTTCVTTNAAGETPAPNTYSEIVWFKTTTTQGGKLIGFESSQTGVTDVANGGQYDRHIYMDGSGALWFGIWSTTGNDYVTVNSGPNLNDGTWHMAVATMGTTGGMRLYVDDVLVDSGGYTASEDHGTNPGWWRVGCGNLDGWNAGNNIWNGPNSPNGATNYGFAGSIDEATVYTSELSASDVNKLWTDINAAPPPVLGLQNGDFETGAISPWTCTGTSGITGASHNGNYAARMRPQGGGTAGECDQTINLLPNHAYTLTAYGARATVGVKNGATGSDSTGYNNYRPLTFNFTTDATGQVTVYLQGQPYNSGYVDDIVIS